jgi:hypothetical protein
MKKLAKLGKSLSKEEQKKINGGTGEGCLGIISCRKDDEGEPCGPVAPGCTCTKNATIPNDYYCK